MAAQADANVPDVRDTPDATSPPNTTASAPDATVLRSGLPLHEQISSWLRGEIDAGRLVADAQLPSEHDLTERFGVSRVTVRRALQTLEADGLIYRRQGLGSFVCDRRVPYGLVRLTDFAQDVGRAGLVARSTILHRATEPCPPEVAERLAVDAGRPVLRLDRLRLGDGQPLAMDRTWLTPFYAQLLEEYDLAQETIYGVLEREYGIPVLSGRYRITASSADASVAGVLGTRAGAPLLVIERTSRTVGERPVYFQRRFYRSDRMAYELELARDSQISGISEGDGGAMPLRDFEVVFSPPSGKSTGGRRARGAPQGLPQG
jgi:GntR family transcriptional regulator